MLISSNSPTRKFSDEVNKLSHLRKLHVKGSWIPQLDTMNLPTSLELLDLSSRPPIKYFRTPKGTPQVRVIENVDILVDKVSHHLNLLIL